MSRLRDARETILGWALVLFLFLLVVGGFWAYAATGPHIDEHSAMFRSGYQEGLHTPLRFNVFVKLPRAKWDAYADHYIETTTGEGCDDPYTPHWQDFAAGQMKGEQEVAATGHVARGQGSNVDCD